MKPKQKNLKVALIAGTARKLNGEALACLIYSNSPLFRHSYNYCKANYDKVYIISAKYGLIEPTKRIESYNESLDFKRRRELKDWLKLVVKQIEKEIPLNSELYFHTGKRLYKLIPYLESLGYKCFTPMKGMSIGKRLKFYITNLEKYGK